jgi:hypothetical protein
MKLIQFAAFISLALLYSCQSGEKEEVYVFKDTNGLTPKAATPVPVSPAQNPVTLSNGTQNIQPTNGQQNAAPVNMDAETMKKIMESMKANPTVTTTQAPNGKTPAGMNPPHGQPGHRCDIAVGAPLNSKPVTQPTAQNVQAQPTAVITQQPTQPTAPGMNPPHGQPGHRCDIAVGAPLNSKPVTPQPQATVTTEQTSKTATAPKKDTGQ